VNLNSALQFLPEFTPSVILNFVFIYLIGWFLYLQFLYEMQEGTDGVDWVSPIIISIFWPIAMPLKIIGYVCRLIGSIL
jgi:hypothetical protein